MKTRIYGGCSSAVERQIVALESNAVFVDYLDSAYSLSSTSNASLASTKAL